MKDKELIKMFNPTLKMKETLLLLLSVVINVLKHIMGEICAQREGEGRRCQSN